jgi:hypothetical protein
MMINKFILIIFLFLITLMLDAKPLNKFNSARSSALNDSINMYEQEDAVYSTMKKIVNPRLPEFDLLKNFIEHYHMNYKRISRSFVPMTSFMRNTIYNVDGIRLSKKLDIPQKITMGVEFSYFFLSMTDESTLGNSKYAFDPMVFMAQYIVSINSMDYVNLYLSMGMGLSMGFIIQNTNRIWIINIPTYTAEAIPVITLSGSITFKNTGVIAPAGEAVLRTE